MTGRVKALAREDSEKPLPSKLAVWRTYLLKRNGQVRRGGRGKGENDLRREVGVGHCRSVFAVENQSEAGTIDNLSAQRISTMDALKAEIATKRKAIQDDVQGPSKYMRRGDLERLKADQEQKTREEGEKLVVPLVSAFVFLPSPPST